MGKRTKTDIRRKKHNDINKMEKSTTTELRWTKEQ
jgi:hypothetical protein